MLWWKARYSMELPETQEHWERQRCVSRVRHTDTWRDVPGHRKQHTANNTQEYVLCKVKKRS